MHKVRIAIMVLGLCSCVSGILQAQSTNASVTGYVTDQTKAVIIGANVIAINVGTNVRYEGRTNKTGSYSIASLPPGNYRVEVEKAGFKTVVKSDIVLHVQDAVAVNFEMAVGSTSETVTVEGGAPLLNTQDAAVSTVVDRQLVQNLPLNGRSFQSLLQLTPGFVVVPASTGQPGQFSVNGQRPDANYVTVDGVSANIGTIPVSLPGAGAAGALPGTTAFGGTNNLASVDAVEEFRVQTSTFAPEFGRQPGAQVSVVTRSGTNALHGTLFDYLRNDVLDANNWFANHNNLPKPKERQNDFGGVLAGPLKKDRTFFFFSYEGLRLRQPVVSTELVPSLAARTAATSASQSYLNLFPVPNGPTLQNGVAQFSASYSTPSSLDATSIRVDQRLGNNSVLFVRYSHAPSLTQPRGLFGDTSSEINTLAVSTDTLTLGYQALFLSALQNDLRLNWSRNESNDYTAVDSFGGAVPIPSSALFPAPFTPQNSFFQEFLQNQTMIARIGRSFDNVERQVNVVDTVALAKGNHQFKGGIDYRHLAPRLGPQAYAQQALFNSVNDAVQGQANTLIVNSTSGNHYPVLYNFSAFVQDSWRMLPRLTATYGVRWEHNPPPTEAHGNDAYTLVGLENIATATLAPKGTPLWSSTVGDFAPRVGLAYSLNDSVHFQTVMRGGFGVFYDLSSSQAINGVAVGPYSRSNTFANVPVPFPASATAPPALIMAPPFPRFSVLYAVVPDFKLPYTLQWNATVQQSLGRSQALSISYVGASGRRLAKLETINNANASVSVLRLTTNSGSSNYNALQAQLERRMAKGLQGLASYTFAKSLDNVSDDGRATVSSAKLDPHMDYGPSDFDIRHTFTAGASYDLPGLRSGAWMRIANGWGVDGSFWARTAPPVNVIAKTDALGLGVFNSTRPNVVPGVPFYIFDPSLPAGKRINASAFTTPPTGQQGNLQRNALRAFGASELDLVLRRTFKLSERIKLQLRAEMFNALNHPDFALTCGGCGLATVQNLSSALFGVSTATLAQALGTGGQSGGFNPLYQVGGSRSVQLALKLMF